jgi:hypothetical protein
MTVWYAGRNIIPPCIPDSHLYRMTNTRRHIGTVFSPDDGHIVARNMYRKTINILRKLVHQVGSICKRHQLYNSVWCVACTVLRNSSGHALFGVYLIQLHYPLFSLRSSSSCFCLLLRLPVTSILSFNFPSITCFCTQFLRKT